MPDPDEPEPIRLARALRPQTFGRTSVDRIREPVVEPFWPGQRVIVGFAGETALVLADGAPVDAQERIAWHLVDQLGRAADGAVLDGTLTKQSVEDSVGIYTGPDDLPSTGKLIAQSMVGTRRNRTEELAKEQEAALAARTFADTDVVNLVVTDLLWLDGQSLLDVPLLERKRLLESILPGDDLVRPGVFVRPPIATWIGSWRAQGFTGADLQGGQLALSPR